MKSRFDKYHHRLQYFFQAQEQCMQLSPVFDIELFDESSEENMIDDDFEDDSGPFVTGQFGGNQGFQTLVKIFFN